LLALGLVAFLDAAVDFFTPLALDVGLEAGLVEDVGLAAVTLAVDLAGEAGPALDLAGEADDIVKIRVYP
jgi:hypothetical protein